MIDDNKFDSLNSMGDIVFEIYPKVEERIMYGVIMFSLDKEDFGGLFVRKNHGNVTFMFQTLESLGTDLLEISRKDGGSLLLNLCPVEGSA